MDTPQAQADAVRSAVSSVATCSPTITALLKGLLSSRDDSQPEGNSKPTTSTTSKTSRSRAKTPAPKSTKGASATAERDGLSTKDKAALATQVVNATLRALGDAARPQPSNLPPSTPSRRPTQDGELVKTATRNLRRSSTGPITPLQPRSLNRVATSPVVTRHVRTPSKPSNHNTNILSTVECARIAFAALRQIHTLGRISLPELQLESGMSALVAKLIALNLHEQAIKELRILKKRLEGSSSTTTPETNKKGAKAANAESKTTGLQAFAEILDFSEVKASGPTLSLIITTQIQALRILSAIRKPAYIEVAVPYLLHNRPSSPTNLLLAAAAAVKNKDGEVVKIARQMETVSQCLLSLTPSVSGKDDNLGGESRLSISPASALELQALALEARLHWWRLAKHSGDVDKDIMLPLSRCLGAYVRRSQRSSRSAYATCRGVFSRVEKLLEGQGAQPSNGSKFPLAGIYQTLTTLARESGQLADAVSWASKLHQQLSSTQESVAKSCSIAAQLLSLHLKDPAQYFNSDSLLRTVLEGIQSPLRGETSELDDLLSNVCLVRRSAINYLIALNKHEEKVFECPPASKDLLETFVLQCPRFALRWLGKAPEPKSSTKDYLRYEQRRQLLLGYVQPVLESAFVVIKARLDSQKQMSWELMESVLGESAVLLDNMGELLPGNSSPASYCVKISHFYYVQYSVLRQQQQQVKDPKDQSTVAVAAMRALRRSVECVKHRSTAEKEKAQLVLKLERLAEICRTLGRGDEALSALQAIRTSLVEDGVLGGVAWALDRESLDTAWTRDEKTEALSRALFSIAKMELVWMDWTVDLPETEQAAALEHRLRYMLLGSAGNGGGAKKQGVGEVTLEHPCVDALLRIYIPTRFPVRRLRVLLSLLCSTIGDVGRMAELRSITRDAAQVEEDGALGEDAGLAGFIPHIKTFYNSLTALIDAYPDPAVLDQSLSAWRSIITACQSRADLDRAVDNVPGLLDHLESIADFLRMKGQDIVLATVLELAADISRVAEGPRPEDPINHDAQLALQYTNIGKSSKAEEIFLRAQEYVGLHDQVPGDAMASLHLASTQHHLALGNINKAEEHLNLARAAVGSETVLQKVPRARRKHLIAYASYLYSLTALQRGGSHHALAHSRESVRVLYQDWLKLESQLAASTPKDSPDTTMTTTMDDATLNLSALDTKPAPGAMISGPEFWKLFPWLYRNIVRLSSIYAHLGMFQETMYYAEQAQKMARSCDSDFYKADCAAWMGSIFAKAANPGRALEFLHEAGEVLKSDGDGGGKSYAAAGLACQIGGMYLDLKHTEGADKMLGRAEGVLDCIKAAAGGQGMGPVEEGAAVITEKMAGLKIADKKPAATRATRKTAVARAAPPKRAPRGAVAKSKAVTPPKQVTVAEDISLSRLRASILVQKAASTLSRKDWAAALAILNEATGVSKSADLLPVRQVAMAACLMGMSMDQMSQDPVFSVIQDSTISFPAVSVFASAHDRTSAAAAAATKTTTPPKKTRGGSAVASKDAVFLGAYVESLREAQDHLLEAHSVATLSGDASLVHKISAMLQNVGLLLAATSSSSKGCRGAGASLIHSAHTSYSVELARNLVWRRERKALVLEKSTSNSKKSDCATEWPAALESSAARRSSLGFLLDLGRFQRDYVDIIPPSWSVISLSLSDNAHDLCITKLAAGQSPFVIRLPLERASSRDADNAVFNFAQGRAELLEIVRLTNATCHDTRDMSVKGAKSAWWAEREALDERLRELLASVEEIWLGGFRGVFAQGGNNGGKEFFGGFQKRFGEILDKHLPSRRQVIGRGRGKGKGKASAAPSSSGTRVTLDPRILELFIGLGDPNAPGCDFDDELTDLLYFVVDILQFHGERNAYDEIDFDSMVVETFDALCSYHSAAAGAEEGGDEGRNGNGDAHTILLLDKSLHVFPWESLPCLQDCPVSRMPSLVCLRRLIMEQREKQKKAKGKDKGKGAVDRPSTPSQEGSSMLAIDETDAASSQHQQPGHHISLASGTLILNPSSDLKSTQTTFEQPLSAQLPPPTSQPSSSGWKRIIARQPSEPEFETALTQSDLLLYFGHGSGAQYIRGKTVRRLEPGCRATVLLMGCSSARLADCGEFEPHGPAWNYLMAGCPAVVGTLWDVTDRDIDRFAGRVLEEWGVVREGTFAAAAGAGGGNKGKKWRAGGGGKGKRRGSASLVQAVNRARGVCRFRYVNAASVVVYGIPVYVDT